jgi:hypothetical protein
MPDISPKRVFNPLAAPPAIDSVAILQRLTETNPDNDGSRAQLRRTYGWRVGAP